MCKAFICVLCLESDGGSKTVSAGTDSDGTGAASRSSVSAPPGQNAVSIAQSVVTDEGAAAGAVAGSDDEVIGSE